MPVSREGKPLLPRAVKLILFLALPLAAILLVVERFTPVNLASPAFLRPADYDAFPLLKDGVESGSHRLEFLSNPYLAKITYSPEGNFFLVEDRHFRKLDSNGSEVFSLEQDGVMVNLPFTHFVVGPSGVYDFSEDPVSITPFTQVLNADSDRTFTQDYWNRVFDQLYAQADSVVYANDLASHIVKLPIYFKIGREWLLLYAWPDHVDISYSPYELGTGIEDRPAKFSRMVLLKDVKEGLFSYNTHEVRGSYIPHGLSQKDLFHLPEHDLRYRQDASLEMLFFRKQAVSEHVAYTNLPIIFNGRADHRLRIGEDTLSFWEVAVRHAFASLRTNLNLFVLPDAYRDRSEVMFLEFRPGNNVDTAGSDGLYVIRRKPGGG